MNLPGFNAEVSLYRSSAYYQIGAMSAGFKQGGEEVVPSARISGWYNRCWCGNDSGGFYCCCEIFGIISCCYSDWCITIGPIIIKG
jgi:hypothetical protein